MSTQTASILVAEFNVTGGYAGEGGTWKQRLPGVVDTMLTSRASIFLLNEAHEQRDEDKQILRALERRSHDRWTLVRGAGGNHFIIDGSKYRVVKKRVVVLPHNRRYVELNLWHRSTGVRFWVWNTHLTATMLPDRPGDVADRMRRDQAEAIAKHLTRLGRSVGGGDINDGTADKVRAIFAEAGHDDVRTRTSDVTNAQWDSHELHYRPNRMRGRWIDLLAAGRLASVARAGLIDSGNASDHNLIYSAVAISGPATKF